MLGWLHNWFRRPSSPLERWSVRVSEHDIIVVDDMGTHRALPLSDLRRVVVATDDSGPWGADVVYLLYSGGADPVCLFPLEATGSDAFVAWMRDEPGFDSRQMTKAMASTNVAEFTVLDRPPALG